jgi:hypothetical protein
MYALEIGDKIKLNTQEVGYISKIIKQGATFEVNMAEEEDTKMRIINYEDIAYHLVLVERKLAH